MAGFTERLRKLRQQAGLSQQELANMMQVTKQTVSQYERGVRKPDHNTILLLCDIFNVSADYLLGKADVTIRVLNSEELAKLAAEDDLSDKERQLIDQYRVLSDENKEMLLKLAEMMLSDN